MELQKTLKNLNSEVERLTVLNEAAEREKSALEREIEALRATISATASQKPTPKKVSDDQIAFDDVAVEEPIVIEEAVSAEEESVPEEAAALTVEESTKPVLKLKKKRVRAMFDNISFDDI
jgi:septal ring factor EnvC (AmiA/AmiB activator)